MEPHGLTWARMGLHYFIDFMSEASVDWGRIVVAKPASPVFMISPPLFLWSLASLFLSIFCLRRVRIEVELFAQNRPPLFLWSLIWTGWKPRFHWFFEVFKERKDALIVCAVSTPPLFFFGNCRKKDFNCLRSIGSPVFLLWKCLISGERCIFSRIVTYFKERKVTWFLFAISTASLYAAENDYVFGSRHRPYERS